MVDENEHQVSIKWADLMACERCQHYTTIGTHASYETCSNNQSPFYRDDMSRLTETQTFSGCEKLEFRGPQLPKGLFQYIPTDSQLRKILPLVVKDYSGAVPEGEKAVAEMASDMAAMETRALELLTKAGDKGITIGELNKAMRSE